MTINKINFEWSDLKQINTKLWGTKATSTTTMENNVLTGVKNFITDTFTCVCVTV